MSTSGATENNAVLSFDIKIPNDAKNVSGEETATVTIKIRNKKTRVIGATNIAFINTPDGFNAKSITQLVQTTVARVGDRYRYHRGQQPARGGGFV